MKKIFKNIGAWLIVVAIGLSVTAFYNSSKDKPEEISYSELIYIIKTTPYIEQERMIDDYHSLQKTLIHTL